MEWLRELGLFGLEKPEKGPVSVCREVSAARSQALLGGAKHQDKRPWAETESQEAPPEHEKELLCCAATGQWNRVPAEGVGSPALEAVLCCAVCPGLTLLEQGGGRWVPPCPRARSVPWRFPAPGGISWIRNPGPPSPQARGAGPGAERCGRPMASRRAP